MRGLVALHTLGLALLLASWSTVEVRVLGGSVSSVTVLLPLWAFSYLAGFLLAQRILGNPSLWRLPHLLVSATLVMVALLVSGGSGSWRHVASYTLVSAALGAYTATATSILFNVVDASYWKRTAALLRSLSGLIYSVVLLGLARLYTSAEVPGVILDYVLLPGAAVVLASAFTVVRPVIPEAALQTLDSATSAIAYGDDNSGFYAVTRWYWALGWLVAVAILLRLLSVKEALASVSPFTLILLYAVFYSIGALLGARLPSIALLVLGGLGVLSLYTFHRSALPVTALSILYSAYVETAVIVYVLTALPIMLPRVTRAIVTSVAAASVIVATLDALGVSPNHSMILLAVAALVIQHRRTSWY